MFSVLGAAASALAKWHGGFNSLGTALSCHSVPLVVPAALLPDWWQHCRVCQWTHVCELRCSREWALRALA